MSETPTLSQMDLQSNHQQRAFAYLREQARAAHREGDGMLAQHLSAIALRSALELAKSGSLQLTLQEIYWAPVFSLNWVVQAYSLTILRHEVMPNIIEREPTENEVRRAVSALLWLVEQPLASDNAIITSLNGFAFDWTRGRDEIEAQILLTFIVELLWYRDPIGKSWSQLSAEWQQRAPSHLRLALQQTEERLKAQSAIAFPGEVQHVEKLSTAFGAEIQMLHILWLAAMRCDFKQIEEVQSKLLPMLSSESWTESRVARILFDFHHSTRGATAHVGDSQELGLTRRHLLTTGAKGHAVPEARDAHFSAEFAEVLRAGPEAHKPAQRFECFRLAMLKEIFALREWDYADWREALLFQSSCYLETARADPSLTQFSATGIRLEVAARDFKGKNDPLTKSALINLDRAGSDIREQLVRQLLLSHLLQCYDALSALSELADSIPEHLLPQVADWCVQFVTDWSVKLAKARGSTAAPLAFWQYILGRVDSTPELCRRLFPAFLKEATDSRKCMSKGGDALARFLHHAKTEQAEEVLDALLVAEPREEFASFERWGLVYNAIFDRPELRHERYIEFLQSNGDRPLRMHHLRRISEGWITGAYPKDAALIAWFRELVAKLSPASGSTEFASVWLSFVHWTAQESDIVDCMIALVEDTRCSCTLISSLLTDLSAIASEADPPLLEHLRPTVERWLSKTPLGQDRNQSSPLAVMRNSEPDQADIEASLGYLALSILKTMGVQWLSAIRPWIDRFAVAPPPSVAPFLFSMVCKIALLSKGSDEAVEFIATARSVFQFALGQAEGDSEWMYAFGSILRQFDALLNDANEDFRKGRGEWSPPAVALAQFLVTVLPETTSLSDPNVRAAASSKLRALPSRGVATNHARRAQDVVPERMVTTAAI